MSREMNLGPGEHLIQWLLLGAVGSAWVAGLVAILAHPILVTNDSLSNYAHVWFVADHLWSGGGIPYRFPALAHGDALAFPYGFLPWFSAALLRPLLGDWVTTLWLVAGLSGLLAAIWLAFPELRRPLPFALLLVNPILVEAVLLSQLPFLWATALLFGAVAALRRDRTGWTIVLAALAQGTHPAVMVPLAGLLVLGRLRFEPRRKHLIGCYVASVGLASPAAAMVFLSPVIEDSGVRAVMVNFAGTVGLRAAVVFAPFAVLFASRRLGPRAMVACVLVVAALNPALVGLRDTAYAWGSLTRSPDDDLRPFLASATFERGATYRLLRTGDGKVGMYQLIRHGAKLDSEFFPESIDRRSWDSESAYLAFLSRRRVDYVIIFDVYTRRYRTNEQALLEALRAGGCAVLTSRNNGFDVYQVHRDCGALAASAGAAGE